MPKFKWRRGCPVLVLGLGLMSCTKNDTREATPFRVAEPTWNARDGSTSKFTQSYMTKSSHNIEDVLSFPDAPSGYVQIHARCLVGSKVLSESHLFSLPEKIPLYSMLPHSTLSGPLGPVSCSLEFHAFNAEGSSHNFRMPEVQVEYEPAAAGIESLSGDGPFTEAEFANTWFTITRGTETLLRCDESEIKAPVGKNQKLALSGFDLSAEKMLRARPSRECRLLGLENGIVVSLSKSLPIRLISVLPKITYDPTRQYVHQLTDLRPPFKYYSFKLENQESFPLRFKIRKPAAGDFVGAALGSLEGSNSATLRYLDLCSTGVKLSLDAAISFQPENEAALVTEQNQSYVVEMPPNSTLEGSLLTRTMILQARKPVFPNTYLFKQSHPIQVETYQVENGEWQRNGGGNWSFKEAMWYADRKVDLTAETDLHCN